MSQSKFWTPKGCPATSRRRPQGGTASFQARGMIKCRRGVARIAQSFNIKKKSTINLPKYIEEIKHTLVPPVSNRVIFNGEKIKVMVVGGPNQRDDFHLEHGEELFYQIKGTMNLDIMEEGIRKTIPINEGNMLLLPSCVPHSPQRYENTIGIVIERTRKSNELDCLRWYSPGTNKILYEEVFHCKDLGRELKAIIDRFIQSKSHKTNIPDKNYEIDNSLNLFRHTMKSSDFQPFDLMKKINDDAVFGSKEFTVTSLSGKTDFEYLYTENTEEVLLWQFSGSSSVTHAESNMRSQVIDFGSISLLKGSRDSKITIKQNDGCLLLIVNKAKI